MRSELPPVADPRPNSAARYQLTAFRIQILYSCARTFLEQKSRKALSQSNSRPMGPRHEPSHLALHSSMLHKVVTLFAAGSTGPLGESDQQMTTRSEFSRSSPPPASPLQLAWLHAESVGRCCRLDFHWPRSAVFPRTLKFNRSGEGGKLICPN
jgi:hypothetical protein